MYSYFVYGLNIHCDFPLHGITPKDVEPEVVIRFGDLKTFEANQNENYTLFATPETFCHNCKNVGTFYFQNGKEVIIDPVPDIQDGVLSSFVTGIVMAVILHQRGFLVLHSSAVKIKDYTAGFLGDSGTGKSTLAAYLQLTMGGSHLTDDALPIVFSDKKAFGIPGYPQLKLWTDSVKSLGLNMDELPKVYESMDKRAYRFTQELSSEPVLLNGLFIVEEGPELTIERLDFPSSFIEIMKNSFMNRYLFQTDNTQSHFEQVNKLLKTVPVFKLQRPKVYELLPEVAAMVGKHILK